MPWCRGAGPTSRNDVGGLLMVLWIAFERTWDCWKYLGEPSLAHSLRCRVAS